jgi:hypothetical protein
VLGVLIEVLRSDVVTARCSFSRKREVSLEDLIDVTADFDVRTAVAVEGLATVWASRLMVGPVTLVAPVLAPV